jgi:hypothetical protein
MIVIMPPTSVVPGPKVIADAWRLALRRNETRCMFSNRKNRSRTNRHTDTQNFQRNSSDTAIPPHYFNGFPLPDC